MSYTLNRKVSDLTPYEPLSGSYRVRLDANESFYGMPDDLLAKIAAAVKQVPFNRYPDPFAVELCHAFASLYGISPDAVTAGNGSDELINIIVTAFSLKGEPCYTFDKDFSMYRFYGEIAECDLRVLKKKDDLGIDIEEVIATLKKEKAGMLLFSNPCNPTSLGLKREDVRKLIRSTDCLVVLDEAYMDFWDQSLLSETAGYDNLIILKTCSKAIGLAGLRLGFAVANQKITKALRAVKSPYNVNAVSQTVGTVVLKEKELVQNRTKELVQSREMLYSKTEKLTKEFSVLKLVTPSVTNFLFIRCEKAELISEKLKERSVAVRCFDGFLRITAGSQEENEMLLRELKQVLQEVPQ